MSELPSYEIVLGDRFIRDLQRLAADARRDPGGRGDFLRQQVLSQINDLADGRSDGHHPLGYEPGKGDLRDCVTAYVQSDPRQKADHRLVFRESGPAVPGGQPRRELLAVKPRQGSGDVYERACARLGRHPSDRQPGLDRFGDRVASTGGNRAQRQAELDGQRAVAQAWSGQQPVSSSRPLDPVRFGRRGEGGSGRWSQGARQDGRGGATVSGTGSDAVGLGSCSW